MSTLQSYRIENNLTLLDVALYLGYKVRSSYNKIEKGRSQPKASNILKLATLFNKSTDEILNALKELEK